MVSGWDRESKALLNRARKGDDAAFGQLYQAVAPVAHRTAHRIVGDHHAADDLVQDTFYLVLKAVRSGGGPRDSFAGYVLLTVKRLAVRYSSLHRRTISIGDPATWERHSAVVWHPPIQVDHVAAAWAGLPARWRAILWLIHVEQYTPAELAPGMEMTPNAVSSLATRARRALRTAYIAMQDDDCKSPAQRRSAPA